MFGYIRKKFVLHATAKSIEQGKISLLAMFECLICSVLLIVGWSYEHTADYVIWLICTTPLLLLRTEVASRVGANIIRRAEKGSQRLDSDIQRRIDNGEYVDLQGYSGGGSILMFGHLFARVLPIITEFTRKPGKCISVIPDNWIKNVLLIDGSNNFEYIPEGPRLTFGSNDHINTSVVWCMFLFSLLFYPVTMLEPYMHGWLFFILAIPVAVIASIGFFLFIISGFFLWLRYAPKATFIIYLPLVLISARAYPKNKSTKEFVQDLADVTTEAYAPHPRESITRTVSLLVFIVTVVSYLLLMILEKMRLSMMGSGVQDPILDLLFQKLPAYTVTTYTIIGLVSVFLTFAIWYVSRLIIHDNGSESAPSSSQISALRAMVIVRGLLGSVLIPNTIYIMFSLVDVIELPEYIYKLWRWE